MNSPFRLPCRMLVLLTALAGAPLASAALTLWIDADTKEYYFTGSDLVTPVDDGSFQFQWSGGDLTTSGGFLVPNDLISSDGFSASNAFTPYEEGGFSFTLSLNSDLPVTVSGDGTRVSYDPAVNTFDSLLTPEGMAALEALAATNTVVPVARGSGQSLTIAAVPEPSSAIAILGGLVLGTLGFRRRSA